MKSLPGVERPKVYFAAISLISAIYTMSQIGWGHLDVVEGYGRPSTNSDYEIVDYKTATADMIIESGATNNPNRDRETLADVHVDKKGYAHAAHAMFFAPDNRVLWGLYPNKAAVMMQMRFDGYLGFPGGLVDAGEHVEAGLNRELKEEIGLDLSKFKIAKEDHLITYCQHAKKLYLHFFVKQVQLSEFHSIEEGVLHAAEYAVEVMGPVRVPLFTLGDGQRGLPIFLANNFAGNAKDELLLALEKTNILTKDEIETAQKASKDFIENHTGKS